MPITVDDFVGTWGLLDAVFFNHQGDEVFPYGRNAKVFGRLIYTDTGYFSAHVSAAFVNQSDRQGVPYYGYSGIFELDPQEQDIIIHYIDCVTNFFNFVVPITSPTQLAARRRFEFEDGKLILHALNPVGEHDPLTWYTGKLEWRKALKPMPRDPQGPELAWLHSIPA